jgi:hypothetical protein
LARGIFSCCPGFTIGPPSFIGLSYVERDFTVLGADDLTDFLLVQIPQLIDA